MSLLFNTLSMFVKVFLPRSMHRFILWLQSKSAVILEPKKIKTVTASTSCPSICHEVMGSDATILVFFNVEFQKFQLFHSLLSPSLRHSFFSSSWLSAIRVVSFVYLRLLTFLPASLISVCDSSSPAFLMMYSA